MVWYGADATVTTWMLDCCAFVSATLRGVVDACCWADLPEQPASASIAQNMKALPPFALSVGPKDRSRRARTLRSPRSARAVWLLRELHSVMLFICQFRVMPPTAPQRLVQRRSVGKAAGLGFDQRDARLLIRLLGSQQFEGPDVSVPQLQLRQIQRGLRGTLGLRGGLQCLGVLIQPDQRVGDVLEGDQHGAAILLGRFDVGGFRGAFLMHELPPFENRRGQRRGHAPEACAGSEHLRNRKRGTPGICGQIKV